MICPATARRNSALEAHWPLACRPSLVAFFPIGRLPWGNLFSSVPAGFGGSWSGIAGSGSDTNTPLNKVEEITEKIRMKENNSSQLVRTIWSEKKYKKVKKGDKKDLTSSQPSLNDRKPSVSAGSWFGCLTYLRCSCQGQTNVGVCTLSVDCRTPPY